MYQISRQYIAAIFTLALLPVFASPALAELIQYVNKYQRTAVSPGQLERIRQFDHYIDYFSGFYYFEPKHRVSADFIRALILAESNANSGAVSSRGALGLGQIIHSTGREAARDLYNSKIQFKYIDRQKLADLKREDLFDPAINILLTCFLMAKYNFKFDGKLELVLSAWNAGEYTRSLSVMKHAPYQETENLIGKVNGYYLYFLKYYQ